VVVGFLFIFRAVCQFRTDNNNVVQLQGFEDNL